MTPLPRFAAARLRGGSPSPIGSPRRLPASSFGLLVGNIHFMLGAAIVLGFRWPTIWAFPLLTKVTPGVGLLWFAIRRDWRRLAIASGLTTAIGLASFALAPHLWFDWVARLRND